MGNIGLEGKGLVDFCFCLVDVTFPSSPRIKQCIQWCGIVGYRAYVGNFDVVKPSAVVVTMMTKRVIIKMLRHLLSTYCVQGSLLTVVLATVALALSHFADGEKDV